MIRIEISQNAQAALERLQGAPGRVLPAIAGAMTTEAQYTVGYIQEHKLSRRGPETLGVRTNRLRQSLRATRAQVRGGAAIVSIGSNVKYAGVHEFGTGPYTIRVRNKKAMRFVAGGRLVFARAVNHPGHRARAYVQTGLEETSGRWTDSVSRAILEVLS